MELQFFADGRWFLRRIEEREGVAITTPMMQHLRVPDGRNENKTPERGIASLHGEAIHKILGQACG